MSSWNNQHVVDSYSDSADDLAKSWYEETVNVPSILELLPETGARVLDFGCGPGNFTARLAQSYEASGADASEVMVNKAQDKYPDISFFAWNGLSPLPSNQAPFTAIVTKLTLEFIEDLDSIAENLYAALLQGGLLVISVQHPLLAISMHPEADISYWGAPKFDVQIGTTGTTVSKIHRNLRNYVEPFIRYDFTLAVIDEPEIPPDIAAAYNARPIDLKFPKRLNIQFCKR